jgi:hypothetical protein
MTRHHISNYLDDTRTMIDTLHTEFRDLERRLTIWAKDGFPSSSGTPGGGSTNTISDPTAQAVLAPDQVRLDREKMHTMVLRLHEISVTLDNIRRTYMTPDSEKHLDQVRKLETCSNQKTCPDSAYAVKAGRCSACYQYNRRTGEDR